MTGAVLDNLNYSASPDIVGKTISLAESRKN